MMLKCCTDELLTRAAFKHHDKKGNSTLKHYAALKGFISGYALLWACVMPGLTQTLRWCIMTTNELSKAWVS